jgi:hypothetical protein
VFDKAVVSAAGGLAERKYCRKIGVIDESESTSSVDRGHIDEIGERFAKFWTADEWRRLVFNRAQELLDEPDIWRAVRALGDALKYFWREPEGVVGDHKGTIGVDLILEIVRGALGSPHHPRPRRTDGGLMATVVAAKS